MAKIMSTASLSVATFPTALPLRQRIIILALVIVAHGVLLSQPWLAVPGFTGSAPRELTVSIVQRSLTRLIPASQPARTLQPVAVHRPTELLSEKPQPVMPQHDVGQTAAVQMETFSNNEPAQPAASGLPDREPDYRAAYLDNPQPEYPLAARRMGWQGRVVLNVEVLADGTPGEVAVHQSSGREMLDNAALRAVRSWRFVPARQGGYNVVQWFLVPVRFNLEMDR